MNIAHLHLAVNHLPVVGVPFALGLFGIGWAKKSTELIKTSYQFFLLVAVAAVVAYFSGGGAEEVVENLPWFSEPLVEKHEELAQLALGITVALGVFSAGALFWLRANKTIARTAHIALLVLGLAATGLMAWTANLGGQIRHDEIRVQRANRSLEDL